MRVFAQKYSMWFSDQHKQNTRVAFDIFSFSRTDLCYSELFLKALSRAMKSASKEGGNWLNSTSYGAFPQAIEYPKLVETYRNPVLQHRLTIKTQI